MNKFGRGGGRGMDRYDPENPPKYLDPNYKNEKVNGYTNKLKSAKDKLESESVDMCIDITTVAAGESGAVSSNEIEVEGPSTYVETGTKVDKNGDQTNEKMMEVDFKTEPVGLLSQTSRSFQMSMDEFCSQSTEDGKSDSDKRGIGVVKLAREGEITPLKAPVIKDGSGKVQLTPRTPDEMIMKQNKKVLKELVLNWRSYIGSTDEKLKDTKPALVNEVKRDRKNLRNEWIRLSHRSCNQDNGNPKVKSEKKELPSKAIKRTPIKTEDLKTEVNEEKKEELKKSLDWVQSLQGGDKGRVE